MYGNNTHNNKINNVNILFTFICLISILTIMSINSRAEKAINGIPAVVGRIVEDKLVNDEIQSLIKDIILMEYKDILYKIEYSDNVNNYDEVKRDEIWKRFILSFNISR
jgi:hypothetical protein